MSFFFINPANLKQKHLLNRPISLLPTIGKVLEKLFTQRLNFHLYKNNRLRNLQYRFREGKSTELATTKLLNTIHKGKASGDRVLVLLIDIKGAFDNIRHNAIESYLDNSACRTTSTAALLIILGIPPLHLQVQREARGTALYRLKLSLFTNVSDIDPIKIEEKLLKTVEYTVALPTQQLTILVDNQASIKSAANPKSHNSIARKIFKLLHSRPFIRVSWIKGHARYTENEEADRLAKEAAETENFTTRVTKTFLRQKMLATWQMAWDDGDTGRLIHDIIP
ncbi:hypothetical protein AVEN_238379-1 [Araneus ventricosus]|uniref:RNase H type-1 domain-containing protein n=1 Tax=Araneus ventricosus TaxID=182803 RepID=A0A4Y2DPM0_ARAVE|nr:hypothetical protein AVEN_238379-1 [Araneus ventricosus]